MRNMVYLLWLLLGGVLVDAHEFIQVRKQQRPSLQKMKEECGDIFAQQLRTSTGIVQSLGRLQKRCTKTDSAGEIVNRMKDIGARLYTYSIQLPDLLACKEGDRCAHFAAHISLPELLGDLTTIIGVIQQHVVAHLHDLINDTNHIFTKKNIDALAQVTMNITSYNAQLTALHEALLAFEQELQGVILTEASPIKEPSKS